LNFINIAVQIIVVAFVFIGGAITLAGFGSLSSFTVESAAPVRQDSDAAAKSSTPVVEERNVAESDKAGVTVALQANSG
jgi:hypothetical protein